LTITINYDADDIMRAALFPEIVTLNNGTKDLLWENQGMDQFVLVLTVVGSNFVYMGINETYWNVYNEVVGAISGDGYNNFMSQWNADVNNTQPFYSIYIVLYRSLINRNVLTLQSLRRYLLLSRMDLF
jgi:hypothetical protein